MAIVGALALAGPTSCHPEARGASLERPVTASATTAAARASWNHKRFWDLGGSIQWVPLRVLLDLDFGFSQLLPVYGDIIVFVEPALVWALLDSVKELDHDLAGWFACGLQGALSYCNYTCTSLICWLQGAVRWLHVASGG